jgi:hypothetical protein
LRTAVWTGDTRDTRPISEVAILTVGCFHLSLLYTQLGRLAVFEERKQDSALDTRTVLRDFELPLLGAIGDDADFEKYGRHACLSPLIRSERWKMCGIKA